MTQAERDRLVAVKKAKKKLITQKQAAEELEISERQVRRLLRAMKRRSSKEPWAGTIATYKRELTLSVLDSGEIHAQMFR